MTRILSSTLMRTLELPLLRSLDCQAISLGVLECLSIRSYYSFSHLLWSHDLYPRKISFRYCFSSADNKATRRWRGIVVKNIVWKFFLFDVKLDSYLVSRIISFGIEFLSEFPSAPLISKRLVLFLLPGLSLLETSERSRRRRVVWCFPL
jgi:hypothetical protein